MDADAILSDEPPIFSSTSEGAKKFPPRPERSVFVTCPLRGAWSCAKWVATWGGPIAFLVSIVALIPTLIGLGSGRGFSLHELAILTLPWFFVLCLGFASLGAVAGFFVAVPRWARSKAGTTSWWARANRPLRLSAAGGQDEPVPLRVTSPPAQPRRRNRRRLWRGIVIGFSCVMIPMFALAFGYGVYVGKQVDARLAAAIAAADRDDPNWRLDDFLKTRERVPKEENAAIVVAKAAGLLQLGGWPEDLRFSGQREKSPPEGRLAYEALQNTEDDVRLDDQVLAVLRDELTSYQDVVRIARGAANLAKGQHELVFGQSLVDTSLRDTYDARSVAKLLAAEAAVLAHDGNLDGAIESCRAILGVARSIGDEPFLVSKMMRFEIGGLAIQSTCRVLAQGEPSVAVLAKLQTEMLRERAEPYFVSGLRGERSMIDETIRRIRDAEAPTSSLGGGTSSDPIPPVSSWGKLVFDNQRAVGLEWMQDAIEIARQPISRRGSLWGPLLAKIDLQRRRPFGKYLATIPLLMVPSLANGDNVEARYKSELGATAILLAAERQRRRTGAWPKTVAEIDPAILPDPPLDPFTDAPYRIETSLDVGLCVHSIGPNLVDEMGACEAPMKAWQTPSKLFDDYGATAWDVPMRRQAPEPPGEP